MNVIIKRYEKFLEVLDKYHSDYILLSNFSSLDPNLIYLSLEIPDVYILLSKQTIEVYTSIMGYDLASFIISNNVRAKLPKKIYYLIDLFTDLSELKKSLKNKKILVNGSKLSTSEFINFKCKKVIDASLYFQQIRSEKTNYEVSQISESVKFAKKILKSAINSVDIFSGKITEKQLANILKFEVYKNGLELAFEPIVASKFNSKFPHAVPSENMISKMCLIDFGVKYNSYCSDITRCFFESEKSKEAEMYDESIKAFSEVVDLIEKQNTLKDLALYYSKKCDSFKIKQLHSLGHGLGLEIHEFPTISQKTKHEVNLRNKTLAIEPGFYFSDFGIRFEETIHIDKKLKVKVL